MHSDLKLNGQDLNLLVIRKKVFLKSPRKSIKSVKPMKSIKRNQKMKTSELKEDEDLPSNLNIYDLIKAGQMSNKDYNQQCHGKSMICKNK